MTSPEKKSFLDFANNPPLDIIQDLEFSDPQTSQRLKKYVDQTEAVVFIFIYTLEFW